MRLYRKLKRVRSFVKLYTPNGYGSTNTKIRRFSTAQYAYGSLTYTDSATNGGSITVNEYGFYTVTYTDSFGAAEAFGLSLNSSQLTTNMPSITISDMLGVATTAGATFAGCVSWAGFLRPGDIVRAHTSGTAAGAPNVTNLTMSQVDHL